MMEVTGMDNYCGDVAVKPDNCEYVEGNVSKRIEVDKHTKACEIRVDIEVAKRKTVRLWGQIKDCKGKPVPCALVKLVKEVKKGCKIEYEGVAHGITDCLGFYQFDLCVPDDDYVYKFRVFVSKQATGKEIVIKKAVCDPCDHPCSCNDYHSSNNNNCSCNEQHSPNDSYF
ncbi:MAG: hypothetical protein N4A64_05705 [Marinisporobacter sp.]|nr:hypothetical protein [Marinisporobacter sp.]